MKIAIYGGSFDPIHLAHEQIVLKLSTMFDKVFVVPAYISPFKRDNIPMHRLKMLQIALKNMPKNVQISTFEMDNQQISYTIDTINHFLSLKAQIHLILGEENLISLPNWHKFDILKQLVTFSILPRAGLTPTNPKNPTNLPKFEYLPINADQISSSLIKLNLAFKINDNLLNNEVKQYITQNKLYTQISTYTNAYKTFNLDEKRVKHSYLSAKYAINLAKLNSVNTEDAMISLVLHDIAKTMASKSQNTAQVMQNFSQFSQYIHPDSLNQLSPPLYHSEIGAQLAKNYFKIQNQDIINAIRYHTTARPNMTNLEKIAFLADKLEYSRTYKGVEQLREIANQSLDQAMYCSLNSTRQKLSKIAVPLCPISLKALQFYKKITQKE